MEWSRRTDDDQIQWKRTPSFPFHESIVPRNAQKQRWWKIINTLLRWWGTIEIVYRTITSVNQLSIYGAVSDLYEEYKTCHVRTGRLVLVGQSDPLFVPTSSLMKTPTLSTDDPAQEDLLQKYQERVERLSQENRVIKFCTDAGFLTTVDVGQYFMTKDTEEFSQFTESVACREYTLPIDEKSSDPKVWIWVNTKFGPVLEVTTSYLQGKNGVEIRVESVNKDNSHSWVRISHGLNKLDTDLSNNKEDDNNEQETSEIQFEDFALKTNVLVFAIRSKAEAKPRRRTPASSSTRTVPIGERKWTDIEPQDYSPIAHPVSKQLSILFRHGHNRKRRRQQEKHSILYWSVRTRNSLSPSSSRSIRTQSHWSFITGQCINSERFFEYIYHIGCAINLHSILNSGLIPEGQNVSKRQTVFFTSVDLLTKNTEIRM